MIPATSYRNNTVALIGLAKSGVATAQALLAGGADVRAWDDDPARRVAAEEAGIPILTPREWKWPKIDALLPSPGVPLDHPLVAEAKAAGAEVIGDGELLQRALPSPRYIGITGTNGKSTTTALIAHVLDAGGQRVEVGGNLGTPVLALEALASDGTYVLEMSSFQLDLTTRLSFDIAVLLNIAPDHLDRHGSMGAYIAAKQKVFRPGRLSVAIIGIDDAECRAVRDAVSAAGLAKVVPITVGRISDDGVSVQDGSLYEEGRAVCDLTEAAALRGAHNWQNAAAAFAAARACGVDERVIVAAIMDFPGLPHRMERLATINCVEYVNDSKATNAEAAARALACFNRIHWIAGGRPKAGGLQPLIPLFGNVVHAYLIGEAEAPFAEALEGKLPYSRCTTLDAAVASAAHAAEPGDTILFSPACASFDQFANFEVRGDTFRTSVLALEEAAA